MTAGHKTKPASGRTTILLTNDDGIEAPGLRHLYDTLSMVADIVLVAPDREQSGVGHCFTFNTPLHYEPRDADFGPNAYAVSGTPVDCVKFAVSFLMNRRPDAVVAGLNVGENSGLSAFYSGTVAAAREGAFWNIPSIAFSLCRGGERFMKEYAALATGILQQIVSRERKQQRHDVYYNVNFPACSPGRTRGIRVTGQSLAFFDDRYETVEVSTHRTKKGYVIFGEKKDIERSNHYDSRALMNRYITITPLMFDATARGSAGVRNLEKKSAHTRY